MRHPGAGGLRGGRAHAFLALAVLLGAACEQPPQGPPPDPLLVDSLGLAPGDRVHVVRLTHTRGSERAEPDSLLIQVGDWVDFLGADGHMRTVRFITDGLAEGPRDYLAGNGVEGSPPLLGLGVHWAVPFAGAPPGRYPYSLSGSGEPGEGVIVVAPRPGGR